MNRRAFLGAAGALGIAAAATPFLLHRRPIAGPGYRLFLGGDVHHGENYVRSGRRIAAQYGYDHSFTHVRPLIARAHYALVNMETPATSIEQSPLTGKHFLHRTHPEEAPAALARHGIRAGGLANNHSMDYGAQGLLDTFAALLRHRIRIFGAGRNLAEAEIPLTLRIPTAGERRQHVAVFGMFEYRADFDLAHNFYATPSRPGVAKIDVRRFEQLVRTYRDRFENLYVIAFPHWGKNYAWRTPEQRELGRGLIDAGADIVFGHHGHNFQEIERYRGKWIFYGIGNFIFNSFGRWTEFPTMPPYGLLVEMDFALDGSRNPIARLYPILVDNPRTNYQPRIPEDREAMGALRRLLIRSELSLGRSDLDVARDELGVHLQVTT
ncbi:MAG: CapA family protein [Pseudomonadota bacterium]|nr:CapA family protein [Pseudomonadota bacterium]